MEQTKKFLTMQEVFDKSVNGLRKQGRRASLPGRDFACMYRLENDEDGTTLKCAAGMLIDDEHYGPHLENRNCHSYTVRMALIKSGVDMTDRETERLVGDLQNIHDGTPRVEDWERLWERLAGQFNLTYTPGQATP